MDLTLKQQDGHFIRHLWQTSTLIWVIEGDSKGMSATSVHVTPQKALSKENPCSSSCETIASVRSASLAHSPTRCIVPYHQYSPKTTIWSILSWISHYVRFKDPKVYLYPDASWCYDLASSVHDVDKRFGVITQERPISGLLFVK